MRNIYSAIGLVALILCAPAFGQDTVDWAKRWRAMTPDDRASTASVVLAGISAEIAAIDVAKPTNAALKRSYDRCFAKERMDDAKLAAALDQAYATAGKQCFSFRRLALMQINDICQPYEQEELKAFGPVPPRIGPRSC